MLTLPILLLAVAQSGAPADAAPDAVQAAKGVTAPPAVVVPVPRPRPPEVPSYKVSLRLKSGRRFGGVVSRDRAFHEFVHAGSHHRAETYPKKGRLRLSYVDGLDGDFVFGWSDVDKIEVREILDRAGLRAMEDEFTTSRIARRLAAESESAESGPAATDDAMPAGDPAAPPAPAGDGGEPRDQEPGTPDPASGPKLPMLAEFPPEMGWTPERKKQIEWRRTVVGSFPDAREARFLEVYAEWEPLFLEWTRQKEADAARREGEAGDAKPAARARAEVKPATPRAAPASTTPANPPAPSGEPKVAPEAAPKAAPVAPAAAPVPPPASPPQAPPSGKPSSGSSSG